MDFQKANFSLLAVHVLPDCQNNLKKVLKQNSSGVTESLPCT